MLSVLSSGKYSKKSGHLITEVAAVARICPKMKDSSLISGFDKLDILRNTPETAKIKVVMMTALSSDDQRARGERLGADRYLVKSQVGIEDVVNAIHEVLGDKAAGQPAPADAAQPAATPAAKPATAPAAQAPVAQPNQTTYGTNPAQ